MGVVAPPWPWPLSAGAVGCSVVVVVVSSVTVASSRGASVLREERDGPLSDPPAFLANDQVLLDL